MRILSISVRNYKSLRNVSLENLGNLTVLIGKNSSGKSNFLEAVKMFFEEFTADLERQIGVPDDGIWYDRDSGNPIEITVEFAVTKGERRRIVPDDWLTKVGLKRANRRLLVRRQLSSTGEGGFVWRTASVRLGDSDLLEQGELVTYSEGEKEPAIPEDQRLATAGELLNHLNEAIQGRLTVVEAARDAPSTFQSMGTRQTMIPPEIANQLVSLQQSRERGDERKWSQLLSLIENLESALSPEVVQANLLNRVGDLRLPIAYMGGGDQAILALVGALVEKPGFLAVEEPEAHLHPALARDVFEIIRESAGKVQTFIVTHSPVFVDRTDPASTWIFKREGIETRVSRVMDEKNFRDILLEIGQRPSDIFFSDRILFVEGQTDKHVLTIWAQKLGLKGLGRQVAVIPTRGVTKTKYHLEMWTTIARDNEIPFAILVDKNGRDEAKAAVSNGLVKKNSAMWLADGDIEDYYPPRFLAEALGKVYGIKLTEGERGKLSRHPRVSEITELLRTHGKLVNGRWNKVEVGLAVASSMKPSDFKQEVRQKLERVANLLA